MFQKFSEYSAQMFEAQVYFFYVLIHEGQSFFFQKVHAKSVTRTELQIAPD